MSYTYVPAGHDGAPIEQSISIGKNQRIEDLISHLRANDRIEPALQGFVQSGHAPLTVLDVHDLVRHEEMDLNLFPSLGVSSRAELNNALLQYTSDSVIYHNESMLVDDVPRGSLHHPDPREIVYCNFGDISSRIIVFDTPNGKDPLVLGSLTENALAVFHQHPAKRIFPYFMNSVLVNFSQSQFELRGKNSILIDAFAPRQDHTWSLLKSQASTTYINLRKKKVVYRTSYPLGIVDQELPLVGKFGIFVNELVERCKDPYSLHDRYGPTPGPAIHKTIDEFVERALRPVQIWKGFS